MSSVEPVLVVLAAGSARRFGGLKQLETVGPAGQALLDYTLLDWTQSGGGAVVLVVRSGMENVFRAHLRSVHRALGPPVHVVAQGVPPGRSRPWGTADAVVCGSRFVPGSCVVANADDFYGRSTIRLARDVLTARERKPEHKAVAECLGVGYPVSQTLSDRGGVSRARMSPDTGVEEVADVKRSSRGIHGFTPEGDRVELAEDEAVSMNLWGFAESFLTRLRDDAESFRQEHPRNPELEYGLSTAVRDQLSRGSATLTVIPARDEWFGMTYPGDVESVRARLSELTSQGVYPERF